ncbi:MAG: hypothetical protein RIB82_23415 [Sneathiellaceae bacterium]
MLSYHAVADIHTNPFEFGMDRLVDLDGGFDFIGKAALRHIRAEGVCRRQVGLRLDGPRLPGRTPPSGWSMTVVGSSAR